MADPKDTTSFFRKVVKFVANPATEWSDLDPPSQEARETEFAKSELKAMIERKRRNDFVRKREFDMLRKVRREGLSGEQLAALGGSSRIDDSEPRADSGARADIGVKAKIDEIEQQMVGDTFVAPSRRGPEFYNAPTAPAPLESKPTRPSALEPATQGGRVEDFGLEVGTTRQQPLTPVPPPAGSSSAAPVVAASALPADSPLSLVSFDAA